MSPRLVAFFSIKGSFGFLSLFSVFEEEEEEERIHIGTLLVCSNLNECTIVACVGLLVLLVCRQS